MIRTPVFTIRPMPQRFLLGRLPLTNWIAKCNRLNQTDSENGMASDVQPVPDGACRCETGSPSNPVIRWGLSVLRISLKTFCFQPLDQDVPLDTSLATRCHREVFALDASAHLQNADEG
jgi:hypothetical protein